MGTTNWDETGNNACIIGCRTTSSAQRRVWYMAGERGLQRGARELQEMAEMQPLGRP